VRQKPVMAPAGQVTQTAASGSGCGLVSTKPRRAALLARRRGFVTWDWVVRFTPPGRGRVTNQGARNRPERLVGHSGRFSEQRQ